jgi:hypothetical protein
VVLDVAGLVPGVGELADGANGGISLARGDEVGAALSFASMVPFAGWGATGAKWARTGIEHSDEVATGLKHSDEAAALVRQSDEVEMLLRSDPCLSQAPRSKVPGLAAPVGSVCNFAPGTNAHKQQRWQEYQERGGGWPYDRWRALST